MIMEVKIQIPDNCELIKDGNTYIVKEKKNKPRSWEEFCEANPINKGEAYIDDDSVILIANFNVGTKRFTDTDKSWCTSKEEAEAFLALMQLRQLRKAWVGDWQYEISSMTCVPSIVWVKDEGIKILSNCCSRPLNFPTKEMAEEFLNCFKDLCETAKVLL